MTETKTKFRIKDLAPDVGDHGWSWTIAWTDPIYCDMYMWSQFGGISERDYRTNKAGDGLFIYGSNGDWHQCEGTCQFGLPADRDSVRRKIRRYFQY